MLLATFKKCFPNSTYSFRRVRYYSSKTKPNLTLESFDGRLLELLEKHEKKIFFNSFIDEHRRKLHLQFKKRVTIVEALEAQEPNKNELDSVALSLKYLSDEFDVTQSCKTPKPSVRTKYRKTHFPFTETAAVEQTDQNIRVVNSRNEDIAEILQEEVRKRQEAISVSPEHQNWMTDYENYDDNLHSDSYNTNWKINYGTPDPREPVSDVPCGGCGAYLHCRDTSIPGYIPAEIYKNCKASGGIQLQAIICQRCHFLKHYNLALQAQVSPDDYPKILKTISRRPAVVVLLVDLLDFPCSIWPGIAEIFWKTPIVVVGNKIDLLPQDSVDFLRRVKSVLRESIIMAGFNESNIQAIELISAKTGFGVETLITQLHTAWKLTGNYYIVGCTNVGKSSLFNILLQSDFCKTQASDLIQRATTSPWPGTTLNLLKFPVMQPSGWLHFMRLKRLSTGKKMLAEQRRLQREKLKNTKNPEYATLIGYLGRTFEVERQVDGQQSAFTTTNENASGKVIMGIDENDVNYKHNRWCYDTPGVVQPDQIIHLLTTEELVLTLPKSIIKPRTFSLFVNTTLFIAGLARLDYIEGLDNVKVTVFCSDHLPITVCRTESAEEIYAECLGSELFRVPTGNITRLKRWPKLEASKEMKLKGTGVHVSCTDIVLSSAGWVAVTGKPEHEYVLKAWTPEGRGIHLRPSLLPMTVNFRGTKVRGSPAFIKSRVFRQ